jgi:hypothetical protein
MIREDRMDELTVDEQTALQVLLNRLLRADPAAAARAMSRITLLWFDWMDRWEGTAAAPMKCKTADAGKPVLQQKRKRRKKPLDDDEVGPAVCMAIAVLRPSHARASVNEFLAEVAEVNGVTSEEERFLDYVRESLEKSGSHGPYR